MKKYKNRNNLISILILGITIIWILYDFHAIRNLFFNKMNLSLVALIISVVLVHMTKAFRLYFALYGSEIEFKEYLKTYCKVTPVSIILPYKTGELYRMYCYGQQIGNYLRGIVIVLLDRFVDTAALLTMITLIWLFNGGKLTAFMYILLIFLVCTVGCYLAFPGVYQFWRRYLLRATASERKIWGLKMLNSLQAVYLEIENVVKGKGTILYFLSLVAWIIEIGSLIITNKIVIQEDVGTLISEYLTSAIIGKGTNELSQFIFVSVVGLLFVYLILWVMKIWTIRKEVNE